MWELAALFVCLIAKVIISATRPKKDNRAPEDPSPLSSCNYYGPNQNWGKGRRGGRLKWISPHTLPFLLAYLAFTFSVSMFICEWQLKTRRKQTNKANLHIHIHTKPHEMEMGKEILVRRYLLQLHLLSSRCLVLPLFRAMCRVSPELCNSLVLPACIQFSYFTHVPCEWAFQDEMGKSVTFLNVYDSH